MTSVKKANKLQLSDESLSQSGIGTIKEANEKKFIKKSKTIVTKPSEEFKRVSKVEQIDDSLIESL